MIDLGTISIKDEGSMVQARAKIFSLAGDLLFDPITATRLATMTSELIRRMLKAGQGSHIAVGLDRGEGAPGLVLLFRAGKGMEEIPRGLLERVFDKVETDGPQSIKASKYLPDPDFEPPEEFIAKERELVERLTRVELYAQLQDAYDKLRQSSQLIQTEKMVTAGTLVAGVAHEMNNPMTALLQFTEYCLRHTAEDTRIYPVLQDMVRETRRCIDIVENLLTFSRMEKEGEAGFRKESLVSVIDRVLRLISYRIEKERVSLKRHIAEGIPEIWMKPSMMQQVFLNLISNALDAVQESDGKEIRIEALCEGGSVLVTVTDNGCGMGPEELRQVFDPFFTTKRVGQGTGLGLSIIQSIIEIHKGKISCESKPGAGTTFRLLLPVERRGGE